jgi:DNA helicase-2/ATP-dependent DNA helicase PcrA
MDEVERDEIESRGDDDLDGLNAAQRAAVEHGDGPLLVIAGAGSGKTRTLAHRVAHLLVSGADPRRIMLLTFTRRAAAEMTRRASGIAARRLRERGRPAVRLEWAGTFHAIANRLLREHADALGLDRAFTVLDQADAADLLDLLRDERGLSRTQARFPKKATCLAIYSHTVNAQRSLEDTLARAFPWCEAWAAELRGLFAAYVEQKQRHNLLDYDDLLLYWHALLGEPALAAALGARFDHVLVDEYQDTNGLQAAILRRLKPDGRGVTVVGDDAQAIYSFRAATVRNILDFPGWFEPPARVVTLEHNYRSTQPILDACNAVIALAPERFTKDLHSTRTASVRPQLVTAEDEGGQVEWICDRILAHREQGIPLKRQAVLVRTAHHSDRLELELGRRDIPFVKFGGLKFLEAAHVKDTLGVLRLAENPRDRLAGFRVLQLLPGMGPGGARRALAHLERRGSDLRSLGEWSPPSPAADDWPRLCTLLAQLRDWVTAWHGQLGAVRRWYEPHCERLYDAAHVRLGDLDQLEQIAAGYPSRERFLTELTLDPPAATGDEAGPPHLDEDFLILSTIHSAKGQEWDVVYVLNCADGAIPSDMSTGRSEDVEEERRLLYVAMTRARDHLHLVHPLRFFVRHQPRHGDRHVLAPRSRFLPDPVVARFERLTHGRMPGTEGAAAGAAVRVDVKSALRAMWQ